MCYVHIAALVAEYLKRKGKFIMCWIKHLCCATNVSPPVVNQKFFYPVVREFNYLQIRLGGDFKVLLCVRVCVCV